MTGAATGALTGALLAAVWQGILLAAVVSLGLRLLPKTPAAVRFAIWFAVFLVVAALPAASLWAKGGTPLAGEHSAWLTLDARWSLAIAAVWLAASAVRAVTLIWAAFRVRALWKRATPVEWDGAEGLLSTPGGPAAKEDAPGVLAAGVGRRAQLCVSDEVDRPAVIGFFAPKILIPGWLLARLTKAEVEQIVLHETGHLGRADDWMNLLQKLALVVFPLNPALAWVERRLCFERELAVDERVLRAVAGRAGAAKAYAACLASLAEHRLGRRGVALAIGAVGRESELGRRVGRILRRGETMRPLHAKLVLGGAMLGLLGASVGLERVPQVIGFAPAGTESAGLDAVQAGPMLPRGYRYQDVMFHANPRQGTTFARTGSAAHESLLKAPVPADHARRIGAMRSRTMAPAVVGTSGRETLLSAHPGLAASVPATAKTVSRVQAVAMTQTAASRDGGAGWVVVTAWQGADGSRMILTTVATTAGQGAWVARQEDARAADGRAAVQTYGGAQLRKEVQPEEDRPRYAAVPVRDGWLVFQL